MKIGLSSAALALCAGVSVTAFANSGSVTTRKRSTVAFMNQARGSSSGVSTSSSMLQMVATSPPPEYMTGDQLSQGKQNGSIVATPPEKLAQRWRKKTKQLATLGPASSTVEMIETLFLAGADVFRLNFSHGGHEEKKELLDMIRQVEDKYSHPIAALGDLQGPKLRVGLFANPKGDFLSQGQTFRFDLNDDLGDNKRVKLPHPEIIEASEIGHVLLIDDGKMKMTVTGKGPGFIDCVVNVEGTIKDRKGVNTPDSILEISPLTPKDRADLEYMLKIGVDWIALSFVQRPEDIVEIKRLINDFLPEDAPRPAVMAKIEKPSCFFGDNLEKIVELCDGIMVARGDLGVECAPEDVPLLQKTIIDECRDQGKPVVAATQMLESMIESPTPTRAEASDVATAIYDGADAIMLSAESAAGKYPQESVEMQQRIINRVEGDMHYQQTLQSHHQKNPDKTPTDAVVAAARQIATTIDAKAIVSFTLGGSTALRASKGRPGVPILAVTPFKETARQLALSWGVYPELPAEGVYDKVVKEEAATESEPLLSPVLEYEEEGEEEIDVNDFDMVLREVCRAAMHKGLVNEPNDMLVVTAGLPFGTPGAANVIRVVPAEGPSCWDGTCSMN